MRVLEKQFGKGGNGIGSVINLSVPVHISGNDIINERNLDKRIRFQVGKDKDKMM